MSFYKFFLGLSILLAVATVAFLFVPGQGHWAIITGFTSLFSFLAAMDEIQ